MTDGPAGAAERLEAAVAAAIPWLPGEAGRDGEPTWAGPRAQSPVRSVRRGDETARDMLVEERVGRLQVASGGHGRTCGRTVLAA